MSYYPQKITSTHPSVGKPLIGPVSENWCVKKKKKQYLSFSPTVKKSQKDNALFLLAEKGSCTVLGFEAWAGAWQAHPRMPWLDSQKLSENAHQAARMMLLCPSKTAI